MDIDRFWQLIDRSADVGGDPDLRLDQLAHELSDLSPNDVVDFQIQLDAAREPLDTYTLWGAASLIFDGFCSDDGFWYFQAWLVGQGRRWWQHVAADPDNLADLPSIRRLAGRPMAEWAHEEWPEWESLDYLAPEIYEEMTDGEYDIDDAIRSRGHKPRSNPSPTDQRVPRDYPRLASLFSGS